MTPEAIALVERYLKGNKLPLISATYDSPEMVVALRSAEAIAKRLETGLSPTMSVQSFDGQFVAIGCGRHPPEFYSVTATRNRPPGAPKVDIPYYSLAARTPAEIVCKDCREEARQNALVTYGQRIVTCKTHLRTILDERGVCERCEERQTGTALNGEDIKLISTSKNLSNYMCPMHGEFSRGHRSKAECPVCHSIDGIADYALTVEYSNKEELKRLKAMLAKMPWKMKISQELPERRRKMIRDIVRRCLTPESNAHLLHIFPSEAFVKGEWLIPHEGLAGLHEYLMPSAVARVMPAVARMDVAEVLMNDSYRTIHYDAHLLATGAKERQANDGDTYL